MKHSDPQLTRLSELPSSDHHRASVNSTEELWTRVEQLLAVAGGQADSSNPSSVLFENLAKSIDRLRELLNERDRELARLTERSELLACAQAEAIVYSAEVIDELEQVKQSLSDARGAAEEAAKDNQRLADTIFERTNDAVMLFEDSICLACNDNTLRILNCEREQILGTWPAVFENAKKEDGSPAGTLLRSTLESIRQDGVCQLEVQLKSDLHQAFWSEITFSRFCMRGSTHVLVVVRDITARKHFEAELRRHRDFLNNIINAVPDQICVRALDQRLVLVNDAFCSAHAIDRETALGNDLNTLGLSDCFPPIEMAQEQISKGDPCKAIERTFTTTTGEHKIASIKQTMFADQDTGERFAIATSRDITDDRDREERMRLLASVFKGASEGVAILTQTGGVCEANPAFVSMVNDHLTKPLLQCRLDEALRVEIEGFSDALQSALSGNPWSGKASVRSNGWLVRSFWISLSLSSESQKQDRRIIALVSDITELENSQVELRRQAMHDNLTGLPNRVYFRDNLTRLVGLADQGGCELTVCFLDLDDFKHANDSLGHACGDQLLRLVAERIQMVMGKETFLARFGGDEFALILQRRHYSIEAQNARFDQLQLAFHEAFYIDDNEIHVGLSIGVTHCPDDSRDAGTLMRNADIAMYAAKNSGKNAIRHFQPEMQNQVDLRHRVQTNLRDALSDGEIEVHYQPKVFASTGQLAGCEALVRWRTSDGRYMPPNEFIPVAEQTGLIFPLGELVFEITADQAVQWHAAGIVPHIAVNVSPHQLRQKRFIDNLQNTLTRTGALAKWFELEITENAMMDDVEQNVRILKQLSAMGFSVAIDDFGTGYSSLSYLKSFKIHTLKIDISFIRDVTHDRQSAAIVRSITSLGTGLGLSVVAEGVETLEQAILLESMGCTILQGYFIGKPMPALQFRDWLDRWQKQSSLEHALELGAHI